MKVDQHYYVTAVLARAAGFSEADALQMAFSDQYTDDAVASRPLTIPGEDGLWFDPVRTAHIGLEAFNWSVQKRVYVPFHFLPNVPVRKPESSWLTRASGHWAWGLLLDALGTRERNQLMQAGIALHTFQDQWSHEGFSGRLCEENNVARVDVMIGGEWKPYPEFLLYNLAPAVGHAELGPLPDTPNREWRVEFKNGRTLTRNNSDAFLDCHRATYKLFCRHVPRILVPWEDIGDKLHHLLTHKSVGGDYIRAFENLFPTLGLKPYLATSWEAKAFRAASASEFYGSLHYLWHRAALDQRYEVLRGLL